MNLAFLAVFMTVDNASTPWHPQFFRPVTFASWRLTQDSPMLYPRHDGVRISEPREPSLCCSSLHVHHFGYPATPSLGAELGFRHVTSCCEVARPCSKVLVKREKFSHLTICTFRVGTVSVLFSLPCPYLLKLDLEFQVHVHSEVLNGSWRWYNGLSFHDRSTAQCVQGRDLSTDVFRRGNSASGRPHWSGSF